MQNNRFEYGDFLVILGNDGGEFDCTLCSSETEVYQVITDRVHDEISILMEEDPEFSLWNEPEYTKEFAEDMMNMDIINSQEFLIECYDRFFADSWWFKVIDNSGYTWFEYMP